MSEQWLAAFRDDPDKAVGDLFSGRAGGGSRLRLDIPELLYQIFPPTLTDERTQLDRVLLSWLEGMREAYPEQVKRLGFSVYAKRVSDALIALQLLDLPQARQAIRAHLDTWSCWLSTLRLAPDRDPALECFRLLTRNQSETTHTAMWLRLASDPRPEYLTVALSGLQHLPNHDNAQKNQMLMLQALLRHAVKTHYQAAGARTFFNRRFATLRGLFPRGPQHWNRILGEALDEFLEHTGHQLAKELVGVLRTQWICTKYSMRQQERRIVPVPQREWAALEADIVSSSHPPRALAERLFHLLEQNHGYAEITGVSHFFVRTLHNVGSQLLQRHSLGEEEMTRFGHMVERALVWEPANPYCWMLWAKWFQTQGLRNAHEWTLREMLRLFPNNEPARVELGRLLIAQGEEQWEEAEHWLQQVLNRNPDSGHSRVVMARLLNLRHRKDEAEMLIVEYLERHPDDQTVQLFLDRLTAGMNSSAADVYAERLESPKPTAFDRGVRPNPLPHAAKELFRRGRLASEFSRARIARVLGRTASTDFIKAATRQGDPLAGFYSQWLMPDETPKSPPHAWAWNACRHWQQPANPGQWKRLTAQFPEAAPETEFLHILAATDNDNQSAAARWRARYCTDVRTRYRAVDEFMREIQDRLTSAGNHERGELAVAVMACAAVDAPDFAIERAA